jgi:hypothetical protein
MLTNLNPIYHIRVLIIMRKFIIHILLDKVYYHLLCTDFVTVNPSNLHDSFSQDTIPRIIVTYISGNIIPHYKNLIL